MQALNSLGRRVAPWLLTATVVTAACLDDRSLPVAMNLQQPVTAGLEVSSKSAAPGDLVAVAINVQTSLQEALQGVQGYVHFDASRLAYKGQSAGSNLVLVNDQAASRGIVRVISIESAGLAARTATLIFEVQKPGYTGGLEYQFEGGATLHNDVARATPRILMEARDLVVDTPVRLTAADWAARLAPKEDPAIATRPKLSPGQYAPNLKYGDANLDGNINVLDVVYLSNISVGLTVLMDNTNRDAVIAGNVRPVNGGTNGSPRPGVEPGTANPDGIINVLDVVAVSNKSVNIATAVVGDVIPGRGPTQFASNRVVINTNITADRTFFKDTIYQIGDATTANVYVTGGATLTIQPGTRIEGWYGTGVFGGGGVGSGQGTFYIQRDARIIADGTALEPIVFTCVLPTFVGPRGEPVNTRWPGCWGGLIISGNATINADSPSSDHASPVIAGRSTGGCIEEQDESDAGTLYGGCNDADSSGVIRYVRSEYGGARFAATKERNGITFNGVGNHTLVDYIESYASLDDGTEYFGGTVNIKHALEVGNEDDNFDFVLGYRGSVQFVIVQADSTNGDRCFEMDNNGIDAGNPDALPRSNPTIYNVTCVGKQQPFRYTSTTGLPATCLTQLGPTGSPGANCVNQAFIIRQNTSGTIRNALAYRYSVGLDFDQPSGSAGGGPTQSFTGICPTAVDQDGTGSGMLRYALISLGPTATPPPGATGATISVSGDPDGNDPGVSAPPAGDGSVHACGSYTTPAFTGTNLEALYIANANNHITVYTNDDVNGDYLVNPLDVQTPDFRPKPGSAPTTLATAPNPGTINNFTFEDAPYYGAVAPANGTGSNIPWYAGWTRGFTTATTK
ncbi:MAG TPA: hypothetical protein VLT79_02375 [Gemmatimonadales bacterium]|nr:hypothetical protein [Gemmatimonadales bacterium]